MLATFLQQVVSGLGGPASFAHDTWRAMFGGMYGLQTLLWHSELSRGKKGAVTEPTRGSYNRYGHHAVVGRGLHLLQIGGRYALSPWTLPFEALQLQLAHGPSIRPTIETLGRLQQAVRLHTAPREHMSPLATAPLEEAEEEEENGKDDGKWGVSSIQSTLTQVWRKLRVRVGRPPAPRYGHSMSSLSRDRVALFGE